MRYWSRLVVILCFSSAFALPIGQPDHETANYFLRELYLRGMISPQHVIFLPADNLDRIKSVDLGKLKDKYENSVALLVSNLSKPTGTLRFDLSAIGYGYFRNKKSRAYWMVFPGMSYRPCGNFIIDLRYRLDSQLAEIDDYRGKVWNNIAGYAEQATLKYSNAKLTVEFGRRRSSWGIDRRFNSLFLSSSAMPMDGLFVNYRVDKRLEFASIATFLSPSPNPADTIDGINRYFSAHALRVSPFEWCDIVLKESVVYGGNGRRPEVYYLFPLLWFHAEQLNKNKDDNTFIGLSAIIRPLKRTAFYIDLLIDDLQIENKTASDREPSEYGISTGACIFDFPINLTSLEITYSRVSNRTYNQIQSYNRYENEGISIGDSLGPDHERFGIYYDWHATSRLSVTARMTYQRRGQGRIFDDWSTPWTDSANWREAFPSGVVEKSLKFGLDVMFQKNLFWRSKLALEFADIKNDMNVHGKNRRTWEFDYRIICELPHLIWRPIYE